MIVRSNISVKRKVLAMCESMKAIEDSMPFAEDEIVEKQTLPSVVRLLANEEFNKETGGYQSETEKDEDDAEGLVKRAPDVDVASKKRKAASPIENAKYAFVTHSHSCHGVNLLYLLLF